MKNKFVEIPANKLSLSKRGLVYGHGINDASYLTIIKIDGKYIRCPFYRKWHSMIQRCFSEKHDRKHPTYRNCTVCEGWLYFVSFKSWMKTQDWNSKEIDKDIIKPGNKLYSPETCCFVTKPLNLLLNGCGATQGECPQGVTWSVRSGKYVARVNDGDKRKFIGCFLNVDDASKAYVKAKIKIILRAAGEQSDERISSGLRLHAQQLRSNIK